MKVTLELGITLKAFYKLLQMMLIDDPSIRSSDVLLWISRTCNFGIFSRTCQTRQIFETPFGYYLSAL